MPYCTVFTVQLDCKSITVFVFGASKIGLTSADIAVVAMSITLQPVRGGGRNLSIPTSN